MEIHIIDVGQGDSILVRQNGKDILIDCGVREAGESVSLYLKSLHIGALSLVLTHPHLDHIGGAEYILNNFSIENVYAPKVFHATRTYSRLLEKIRQKGLCIHSTHTGMLIDNMQVLNPNIDCNHNNLNDYSIILSGEQCLLTGDASASLIPQDHVDFLKVAHHGSRTGTTSSLIDAMQPSKAAISYGVGNPYGHPHKECLEALQKVNVMSTAKVGTVIYRDGKMSNIQTRHQKMSKTRRLHNGEIFIVDSTQDGVMRLERDDLSYITVRGSCHEADTIKYHEGGFSHVEGSDPRMTKVLMDEVFD